MADPVAGGGVAGALAAVSAPVTKLVETVSAGLGRVYEPTHQRRMAKAEGDRMVILANAANEVTDIQRRAADRWLAVETIRQQNIEAIADKASSDLPPLVSESPVDQGWAAKFFDLCKDVSHDHMQGLWAKLLAGEVTAPGTYSLRTMHALAAMTQKEAQLFDTFCSLVFVGNGPFVFADQEAVLRDKGLGFTEQRLLEQAGLVRCEPFMVRRLGHIGLLILMPLKDGPVLVGLHAAHHAPVDYDLGTVMLTQAGEELARLWHGTLDAEHAGFLVNRFKGRGWRMQAMARVKGADGNFGGFETPDFMLEFLKRHGD